MPSETGIWGEEEAKSGHDFSYKLARFIGDYFPKDTRFIDLGCGPAEYLRYLHDRGFSNLYGIEGTSSISFEFGNVDVTDLTKEINIDTKGNVMCLEVGEHIPEQFLEQFLDNIANAVNENDKLLLSWAIPGQDGIGHVSCRHNIWVINEMIKRKFSFLGDDSLKARSVIEDRLSYFRNTILVFQKKKEPNTE